MPTPEYHPIPAGTPPQVYVRYLRQVGGALHCEIGCDGEETAPPAVIGHMSAIAAALYAFFLLHGETDAATRALVIADRIAHGRTPANGGQVATPLDPSGQRGPAAPNPPPRQETVAPSGADDDDLRLVLSELAAARARHPGFAERFTDRRAVSWADSEAAIRARNDTGPQCADNIIMEELAEAMAAYEAGDLPHARVELAQCAAVCLRAMERIRDEIGRNRKQENDK